MRAYFKAILLIFTSLVSSNLHAQSGLCDSITPFYVVDMTGQPNGTYISPPDIREGNCCGTSHPVRCIEFEITLDPNAVGLQFDIYSGAAPSGSLFYQVNCGPEVPVGSIICLNGVGPHTLTFCKPGSNQNEYAITSIPGITNSETSLTAEGCSTELYVSGYEDSTIVWNEISSGSYQYNPNLSCLNGCDTTTFTATANMPDSIIVEVCGYLQAGACMPTNMYRCDTLVVDIYDPLDIIVDSIILPTCENSFNYNVSPAVLYGSGAYAYYWYDSLDGFGNLISTDSTLAINASGEYSLVVIDSLFPDCSRDTMNVQLSYPIVFNNSGSDTTVCLNDNFSVTPVVGNIPWDWYLNDSLACASCPSFAWTVTDSVNLEIIPLDSASCWDTLNLNVFPAPIFSFSQAASICSDESFILPSGISVNTAGTYIDTFSSSYGCDSIWTTQISVLPSFTFNQTISICDNESFVLPSGIVANTAGTYVDSFTTSSGCDSIWTTTINVNPSYAFNQNINICDGDSFALPSGLIVSASGSYIDSFTSVNGCDSVWTTQLNVNPVYNLNQTPTICANESFTLPSGNVVSVAGTYIDTFTSSLGCDSIWTTQLSVLPSYNFSQTVSICSNENFTLPSGNVVNSAGTYVDSLIASTGCDSVWTTTINVNPSYAFNQTIDICAGDSFGLPSGLIVSASGSYIDSFTSVNGCDSVWTTQLNVNPVYNLNQTPTICANESFTLPSGNVVSVAGTYIDTFTSSLGCDSIWTTQLNVLPSYNFSQTVSICSNENFTLPSGNVVNSAGTYVDSLIASTGCDSVWTTTINVNPSYAFNQSIDICAGDSFVLPSGLIVSTSGSYIDSFTSVNGCDSVWTTQLNVNPVYNLNQTPTICANESFTLPSGNVVNVAGTYIDTFTSSLGCDSIWTTQLSVLPTYNFSQTVSICSNENFTLPSGNVVNSAGTYVDSLIASTGCDSVWTTTINVNPSYAFNQSIDICAGDSFVLPSGLIVRASGSYIDSFTSVDGCDSVWTTQLNVNPVYNLNQTPTICANESFTLPSGNVVSVAGTYIDTFTSSLGCDSIWNTQLSVLPTYNFSQTVSICSNENFTLPSGNVVNSAGTYVDSLTASTGCDSVWTTTINVNPVYDFLQRIIICENEAFTLPSGVSVNTSGIYVDTFASVLACDSIWTTDLTVNPSYNLSQNVSICSNETYTLPSGNIVNSAGVYIDSFTTLLGCDSVWTTNLSINPSYTFNQSITICSNEFFTLPSGQQVNRTGVYTDSLVSSQGCDSIWVTELFVNPSYSFNQSIAICENEYFTLPSGVSVNSTGIYVDTLLSSSGCDSIWTTDLSVYPNYTFTQNITVCAGDSVLLPSGIWTSSPGIFVDSFSTSTACDSVWITNVKQYQPIVTTINETLCSGDQVTFNNVVYSQTGFYMDTMQSVYGCDSVLAINIVVNKNYALEIDTQICANEPLEIDGVMYSESGTFTIHLSTAKGCDSIITLNLEVMPVPSVYAGEDFTVYPNTLFYLQASDFPTNVESIFWSQGDTALCANCFGLSTSTDEERTYTVTVVDSNSCKASDEVEVDLKWDCPTEDIEAPNIITPNGDGHNDYFYIENVGGKNVEFLRIYNRWGELVFESYDPYAKWDGTFRNQACNPDVYVYYIKTVCVNGAEGIKKGNITILK